MIGRVRLLAVRLQERHPILLKDELVGPVTETARRLGQSPLPKTFSKPSSLHRPNRFAALRWDR